MENSLLVIFDEIWPMTLYYSTGCFVKVLSNLKIHLKEVHSCVKPCMCMYIASLCLLISYTCTCINWFSKQVESSLLCVCVCTIACTIINLMSNSMNTLDKGSYTSTY